MESNIYLVSNSLKSKVLMAEAPKKTFNLVNITLDKAYEFLKDELELGFDTENSSLDCWKALPLLLSIGNRDCKIVIDCLSVPKEDLIAFLTKLKDKLFIMHNAKYDVKVYLAQYGYEIKNIYCTLLVEQSLRRGLGKEIGRGIVSGNGLDKALKRRLNISTSFSKDLRNEFIDAKKSFKIRYDHIVYSAEDIAYMVDLKKVQEDLTIRYSMHGWLYNVEFPLVNVIASAEVEGIPFDSESWLKVLYDNKKKKFQIEKDLDKLVIKYSKDNNKLKGGKYTNERNKETIIQKDFFSSAFEKEIENKNKNNINYSSDAQIKDLFKRIGCTIPLVKNKEGMLKESTGIDALANLIIQEPDIIVKDFIIKFIEFQKVDKEISSFGKSFIDSINPITGNIHTIYRQNSSETGRFQSGGGKDKKEKIDGVFTGKVFKGEKDKYNSQQIPGKNVFRNCFGGDPEYTYQTLDLTGAELNILASLANDDVLLSILDDPHSPLATVSYRGIVKYILNNMTKVPIGNYSLGDVISPKEEKANNRALRELEELLGTRERAEEAYITGTFTITKGNASDLRNGFKTVIYGLSYGASEITVAEALNLPIIYAKIIISELGKKIPKTFRYLEQFSEQGLNKGYIIMCERSQNRRWFYDIAKGNPVSFKYKASVVRESKNAPMQGTQSDMVKEASVEVANYFIENNYDAKILLWIHDEWVIRLPNALGEEKVKELAETVKQIITTTCSKFLKNSKMGAAYKLNPFWVK